MIKELWAKLGGKKQASFDFSGNGERGGSVVPLRGKHGGDSDLPESLRIKKDPAELFEGSVNQLVDKLDGIREHLGKQVQQNEQLLEQMALLPEVLKSMPTAVDRQEQAMRALAEEMKSKGLRDAEVMEMLSSLPQEAANQSRALGEIHTRLTETANTDSQISDHIGRVSKGMDKLGRDTIRQTEKIEDIGRIFNSTDLYLKYTLEKQNRRFLWVFVIGMGICLAAVAGLIVGIFLLSRGT